VKNPDTQISNAVSIAVTNTVSTPVTISISPLSVNVTVSKTFQFTATVANTTDKRVTWKVNGVIGGSASTGTISTTGLYKAPATVPSTSVRIFVTSVADPTKIALASVGVLR
jgi:hypothetical protein